MNKNIFLFFSLLAIIWGHKFENCSAQGAAINIIGAIADSSAILDVNTTNQGILIPRLTGSGWYMLEYNIPSITGQPVAQTICEGNNISFSITATGAGLTYQWQLSTDGGSTWTNQANGGVYSNMTTATMNITAASAGMNSYQYHCVVSGTYTLAAISDAAALTVNPLPDITATPSSQTICSGATTDIALTSDVTGTAFAWTVAQSGVTGASDGSGSNITQTLTNSGTSAGTATYTITPTANTCSGTSTDVVITVNPTPNVTATPSSQAICSGSATGIALTSDITGTAFAWTVVQSEVTGATEGSGSSIAQTLTNTGTATGTATATYTITPTASGCSGTSTDVIITVNPIPDVTATPSSQTICGNTVTGITLTSNVTGTTFAWTVVQSGVTGATDGSGSSIAQTLTNSGTTAGTATYSITPTASGCSGTSTDVVITVNPLPDVIATPSSQMICSGAATDIALTSDITGTTFAWTVVQSGVTGATDGSGSSIAQTLTNSGTTAGTATCTITPTASGCSGTSTDVVITVNPTPVLSSTLTPTAICSGTTFNYTATSAASGATFAWSRATISGITEAGTTGTGDVSEALTNTTFASINVTYVHTITANGCPPNTQNVVVTVNPIPNVTLPSSQTICSNTATNITLTSNVSGATFAWTVAQSGVTGAIDGSGSNIAQILTNSGTTAGTATYTITPSYTNGGVTCAGTSTHVVITVAAPCGTTGCYTGTCSGSGVCNHYTSGDGNCPICKTCVGATSGACINYTDNTQDAGCNSTCQACQSGSCGYLLLVYSSNTCAACIAQGGTIVGDGSGNNMCRFNAASCPSGWTRYSYWSTTSVVGPVACCVLSWPAYTGSHAWADINEYDERTIYCTVCTDCYCYCQTGGYWVYPTITQIGCY